MILNIPAPPAKPQGPLEAIETRPDAITVAWKPPPDDGGARVQKYVLEKKPKGGRWSKVPGKIFLSITFTNVAFLVLKEKK